MEFKSVSEIKKFNKSIGNIWFDEDTMAFFGTKIETDVLYGKYFITSEDNFQRTGKIFNVREVQENGSIHTVNIFNEDIWKKYGRFSNLSEAKAGLSYFMEQQELTVPCH